LDSRFGDNLLELRGRYMCVSVQCTFKRVKTNPFETTRQRPKQRYFFGVLTLITLVFLVRMITLVVIVHRLHLHTSTHRERPAALGRIVLRPRARTTPPCIVTR
ncbi:unnamed protein product, partial [Laminaria digitata]